MDLALEVYFFSFSTLLLASLGQHVARLCWFLSSCNQAKTHMSKNMFSSSLKRSSLFFFCSASRGENSVCLILILAYEVLTTKCFFIIVLSCQSVIVIVIFNLIAGMFYLYQGYFVFQVNITTEKVQMQKYNTEKLINFTLVFKILKLKYLCMMHLHGTSAD